MRLCGCAPSRAGLVLLRGTPGHRPCWRLELRVLLSQLLQAPRVRGRHRRPCGRTASLADNVPEAGFSGRSCRAGDGGHDAFLAQEGDRVPATKSPSRGATQDLTNSTYNLTWATI